MRKSTVIIAVIIIVIILCFFICSASDNGTDFEDYAYVSGTDIKNHENELVAELLKTEEDIQYYAYLNLDTAEEEIKPVILAARNVLIHRQGWVAEGKAEVVSPDGTIVESLPYFYDIFPSDWDIPIVTYGKP